MLKIINQSKSKRKSLHTKLVIDFNLLFSIWSPCANIKISSGLRILTKQHISAHGKKTAVANQVMEVIMKQLKKERG